jgi:hypothetical protein
VTSLSEGVVWGVFVHSLWLFTPTSEYSRLREKVMNLQTCNALWIWPVSGNVSTFWIYKRPRAHSDTLEAIYEHTLSISSSDQRILWQQSSNMTVSSVVEQWLHSNSVRIQESGPLWSDHSQVHTVGEKQRRGTGVGGANLYTPLKENKWCLQENEGCQTARGREKKGTVSMVTTLPQRVGLSNSFLFDVFFPVLFVFCYLVKIIHQQAW